MRDWFLKRNPKIKSLIDFSVKILPDFIIQELLLSANTTAEVVSVKEKLTFQDYYKLAAQLAFLKVENILRAYLPGHYCLDEETHSPLHVSTWIFMEMLRPELYRKCSLFIHR